MARQIKTPVLIVIIVIVTPIFVGALTISQPVFFYDEYLINEKASSDTLKQHVQYLTTRVPSRNDDADSLEFSARYIENQLSQYGDVRGMPFEVWGIPYKNISITFGGDSKKRIIIGAHYDSFEGKPGADDNASGVAGLIELARLLSNTELDIPVQLVAYALEEPPYFRSKDMGSAVHARQLDAQNVDVLLMVSLEMIGYFTDAPESQEYPAPILNWLYPTVGNYIAVVGNLSGIGDVRIVKSIMKGTIDLPVYSINAPGFIPGIDFSDHLNFWQYEYPAIMVTDTAFYRNKAYHSDEDTWDRLDYNRMSDVVTGVYSVIVNLSKENR